MKEMNDTFFIYVFCGQKIDWDNRNLFLYYNDEYFKYTMDSIDSRLKEKFGFSTIEQVIKKVEQSERIKDQVLIHLMLFIFQVSLYQFLTRQYKPDLIMGMSCGEINGLYCSGAIDFDTACDLVYKRGSYLNKTLEFGGAMIYVFIGDDEFRSMKYIKLYQIEISGYISPNSVVYGGKEDEIDKLAAHLKNDNIPHKKISFLKGSFHTSHMEAIKNEVLELKIKSTEPSIPYLSCANLKQITQDCIFDEKHLYENIRNPVMVSQAYQSVFTNLEKDETIKKVIVQEMSTYHLSSRNYVVEDILPSIKCNKFSYETTLILPSKPITNSNYIIDEINNFINK